MGYLFVLFQYDDSSNNSATLNDDSNSNISLTEDATNLPPPRTHSSPKQATQEAVCT